MVCYLQAVLNLVAGSLYLLAASVDAEHGVEVPGVTYLAAVVSFVVAVALVAGAVQLTMGVRWARYPVAAVQGLNILGVLMAMASLGGAAFPAALAPLLLSVVVLINMFSAEVTEWFGQIGEGRRLAEIEEVPAHLPPIDFPGIH